MIISLKLILLLIILLSLLISLCYSRTAADELNELTHGDGRILLGAYMADTSIIAQGLVENGDMNSLMTPFLGEKVLTLGKYLVNFPLSPALHLTFFHGQKSHLDTAFFMMIRGSNPNKFELPSYYNNDFKDTYIDNYKNPSVYNNNYQKDNIINYLNISYGYPPAIMYCLGLGIKPTNNHAGFLKRIYQSLPSYFNITSIEYWRNFTGNPPILHIPMLINFFDGVYTLVEDMKYDINVKDDNYITSLHIAAWKGDDNLLLYLLSRGCNITSDIMGRTPLHYAAMRGHSHIITLLFKSYNKKNDNDNDNDNDGIKVAGQRKLDVLKADLIKTKDAHGRTALHLAAMQPSLTTAIRPIRKEMTKLKIIADDRWTRAPKADERSIIDVNNNNRGGWYYPNNNNNNNNDDDKTDIDVIKASKFTRKMFINDYLSTQRPLLVTDNLFNKQYIWLYWEKQFFIDRYGSIIVKKGERLHSTEKNPWTLPQSEIYTIKTYIEKYMNNNNCNNDNNNNNGVCYNNDKTMIDDYVKNPIEDPWVAHTNNSEIIANDIKKPHSLRVCGDGDNEDIKLTLGPAGTGIPMHSHNATWNLLLTGKKKWYLIAPGQGFYNNEDDNADFKAGKGAYNYHIRSTVEWLRDKAPLLRSKGVLHEVIQYPGDVVILPHDWYHATLNLADTIAISQEFCTFKNTIHRIMPLGKVIYGGKDYHRNAGPPSTFSGSDADRIEKYKKELSERDKIPRFDQMRV